MSGLKHAESFRDLLMYQKARALQRDTFALTRSLPLEERFALTGQLRRSSRSIGANIAEAWGKRRYEAHFISKLTDADGESYETQHWIETAIDCGYLEASAGLDLIMKAQEVGRLLGGMMEKAALFCGSSAKSVHEQALDYLVRPPSATE